MWFDRLLIIIIVAAMGGMVLMLPLMIISAVGYEQKMEKLTQSCVADGHKDYECYGIIRNRVVVK